MVKESNVLEILENLNEIKMFKSYFLLCSVSGTFYIIFLCD